LSKAGSLILVKVKSGGASDHRRFSGRAGVEVGCALVGRIGVQPVVPALAVKGDRLRLGIGRLGSGCRGRGTAALLDVLLRLAGLGLRIEGEGVGSAGAGIGATEGADDPLRAATLAVLPVALAVEVDFGRRKWGADVVNDGRDRRRGSTAGLDVVLAEASLGLGVEDQVTHAAELGGHATGAGVEDGTAAVVIVVESIGQALAAELALGDVGGVGGGDGVLFRLSSTSPDVLLLVATALLAVKGQAGGWAGAGLGLTADAAEVFAGALLSRVFVVTVLESTALIGGIHWGSRLVLHGFRGRGRLSSAGSHVHSALTLTGLDVELEGAGALHLAGESVVAGQVLVAAAAAI
jgi:hypothetical protein